ncbi:hypothetical protein DFP94_11567 [Fontibacillus phaseoli]|uniref:Integrase-like protein n=1 Tax=Fontibacillus phaseoli TaxID=1416533 RepID=A0A369B1S1_9BACL|nr:hypothetical protein DFP94_11567 [Fontibacillus phaseoli]
MFFGFRRMGQDVYMKDPAHAYPGYICFQAIQYIGSFPKVGKVYQYVTLDSYSRLALVKLYNRKSSIQLIEFMRMKIIPLLRTFHLRIDNLVTNKGQEFSTTWERGSHKGKLLPIRCLISAAFRNHCRSGYIQGDDEL